MSTQGLPATSMICPRSVPFCAAARGVRTDSNSATVQALNNHEYAEFLHARFSFYTASQAGPERGPLSLDLRRIQRSGVRGSEPIWNGIGQSSLRKSAQAQHATIAHAAS